MRDEMDHSLDVDRFGTAPVDARSQAAVRQPPRRSITQDSFPTRLTVEIADATGALLLTHDDVLQKVKAMFPAR
jgi:hypothetical protein